MSTGPQFPSTFGQWVVAAIVCAGILAVAIVLIHSFGIVIPGFVVTILWIVLAVVVGVVAVKFLLRLF